MKLFYQERGEGFPIIILHGLMGMSDNWATVGSRLSGRHRVVMVDLRNHGRSPHEDEMDMDTLTQDILDLMDDLLLEKSVVMGHSLGGKVAMNLALKFPSRVQALVVVDIGPRAYPPHHGPILDALEKVPLASIQRRQEAEEILAEAGLPADVRQFLLKSLVRDEAGHFRWRFNLQAIRKNLPYVGAATPTHLVFSGPALFIKGSKSDYLNDEDALLISRLFPKASLAVIPDAGHWVHADAPEPFLQALEGFLLTV
ncbi:MAG: alpha/beta fold hydrolase [Flavobacteriales bacterium]|nr:alpha/beta fold hydrolase [Flavobacteriales bacterium]MCX7651066.1 alpha/beta fold hydrolase [Flavobacteriales bacterium]MDW8432054.1 alpha/beta fold hydrolase [Flavobacteriales bacterium]